MPIYEYKCGICGAKMTVRCEIEERQETVDCVSCGSVAPYVFSSFNVGGRNSIPGQVGTKKLAEYHVLLRVKKNETPLIAYMPTGRTAEVPVMSPDKVMSN